MFLIFFERLGHGAESAQNRIGIIQGMWAIIACLFDAPKV